jgi:hypothetical protein
VASSSSSSSSSSNGAFHENTTLVLSQHSMHCFTQQDERLDSCGFWGLNKVPRGHPSPVCSTAAFTKAPSGAVAAEHTAEWLSCNTPVVAALTGWHVCAIFLCMLLQFLV